MRKPPVGRLRMWLMAALAAGLGFLSGQVGEGYT
jgi:hypothetical protein